MKRLVVAPRATLDIDIILAASEDRFGEAVAGRYRRLLAVAMRDLREDPTRAGVASRPEASSRFSFYHLRHSRARTGGVRIARPRHVIVFEDVGDLINVVRVLHDAMDFERHLEGL